MAKKDAPGAEKKQGRAAQLIQSYRLTKEADPRLPLILWGAAALGFVGGFALALLLTRSWIFGLVFGVLFAGLIALIVFGRRAQSSAFAQIEGQPGAAAAALSMLKRGWHTDPAIAFNKQQDVVTRLVGPPGIVLIGEGNPNRLKPLLASERRKHERVVSETPLHEIIVGDAPGEVPLRRLTKHVSKLRRELKPAQMTDVLQRLKALDANRSNIPLPKGPVPTSMKGMRGNLRGR